MSGTLDRFLELALNRPSRTVVGPRPPTVIRPLAPITVAPPPRQAWDEKRWRREEKGDHVYLTGCYRVYDRRRQQWREFDGRLVQHGRRIWAYIADPPPEAKQHPHGSCLQLTEAPWFHLHWNRAPRNLDQALLYVERMLDESLNPEGAHTR